MCNVHDPVFVFELLPWAQTREVGGFGCATKNSFDCCCSMCPQTHTASTLQAPGSHVRPFKSSQACKSTRECILLSRHRLQPRMAPLCTVCGSRHSSPSPQAVA